MINTEKIKAHECFNIAYCKAVIALECLDAVGAFLKADLSDEDVAWLSDRRLCINVDDDLLRSQETLEALRIEVKKTNENK